MDAVHWQPHRHAMFGTENELQFRIGAPVLKSAFGVMSFFFDTSQKKKTGEVWQRESLQPFWVSFHEKKKFSHMKLPHQNLLEKKTGLDLFLSHSRA